MPRISAIVLAGAKSQRLGMDKALLEPNGERLLGQILDKLASLSEDLFVVADNNEKLAHLAVPIIPDACPGTGLLGGIYSGRQAMHHERGLFVACDISLLKLLLLQYMIQQSTDFEVVIPHIACDTEPLHAIYSKTCVRPIADALNSGERLVTSFSPRCRFGSGAN